MPHGTNPSLTQDRRRVLASVEPIAQRVGAQFLLVGELLPPVAELLPPVAAQLPPVAELHRAAKPTR